jgi:hypothetical protein
MADYNTYTNSELEDELKRLTTEYEIAQKNALENYQLMIQLSQFYGEVNNILETRQGKKKGDK